MTLTDSLATYGAPEDPLIPLRDLAQLLDLDLDVEPGSNRVTGRLGEAQRAVIIDLATGTARIGGKPIELSKADYAVTPSDIYFRASALQRLLPVSLAVNSETLEIKLIASETLPVQARMQRIARLQNLGNTTNTVDPVLKIPSPYQLFSPPAFDISTQFGLDTTKSGGPTRQYDVRVGDDLLYTGFQGYLGSNEDGGPSTVRATFERHQVGGGLLGPINATKVTAGDVFTPSLPIGAHSTGGRGFTFSTAPLEQTSVFDHIDLRGELPLGYDVELYVNDVLRSGQRTPVQGRYEFLSVPLVRGINIIRIVTYGPHGERTEQTRVVNVSSGQVKSHTLTFEFGIVQQNQPVLTVGLPDNTAVTVNPSDPNTIITGPTVTPPILTTTPGDGRLRSVADLTYGLTNTITLVAGAALYPVGIRESRELATLGVRTSLFGMATQLDAARDNRGGLGVSMGVAGRPFGISLVANDSEYHHGFIDENYLTDPTKPLTRHTSISLDGALPFHQLVIPLSASVQQDTYSNGDSNLVASTRTSWTVANILLSSGLDFQRTTSATAPPVEQLLGALSASTFAAFKWQLRGSLDYAVLPKFNLGSFAFTADRDLSKQFSVHLGLGQSLSSPRATTFQGGSTWKTRFGDLSLTGNYTVQNKTWSVGLQFQFGLLFDPINGRYGLTRSGPATEGSVAFQAFVDHDGDGKFDAGDEPVPKVMVDGGEKKVTTGANGQVLITGLGTPAIGHLQIGLDDIDDPYVQAPPHTIEFSPRAGLVVRIPYAMTATGEVLARVSVQRNGKPVGLSAVRIRLVRAGAPPIEGLTEFDGTVSFEHLPPGAYSLELDPDQAARLRMHLVTPISFTVSPGGGFVPDLAPVVEFEAAPADAPAATDAPAKEETSAETPAK